MHLWLLGTTWTGTHVRQRLDTLLSSYMCLNGKAVRGKCLYLAHFQGADRSIMFAFGNGNVLWNGVHFRLYIAAFRGDAVIDDNETESPLRTSQGSFGNLRELESFRRTRRFRN